MKKYRINKNREELPDEEEILKYKDFGKLKYNYEKVTKRPKKPLYKDPKAFLGLLLVVLVVYIVSLEEPEEKDKVEDKVDNPKDSTTQVDQ